MENLLLSLAANGEEPAVWFVCLLGVGVVFVGLICIIGIVYLMNMICDALDGKKKSVKTETAPAAPAVPVAAVNEPIANRQEILAAVCAAVAEENGTDISAVRVISFKKL